MDFRKCGCQTHHSQLATFGGPDGEDHYPRDLGLASKHLEITLEVDIESEVLRVRVVHEVIAHRNGERNLELDGVDFYNLAIGDPTDQRHEISHTYDSKKIAISWDKPFEKGEVRKVQVTYEVRSPQTGLYFMHPVPADLDRPLYVATDHETERARYWLACVDFPNLKTTIDWHITAPEHLTILANGYLVREVVHGDGKKTAFWQLKQLCPSYLACFAVGDFVSSDHGSFGNIPVASFATKQFTSHHLDLTFGRTGSMLEWMIERLGVPFPYPKYFQFALPNFGGAMENISLVSWTDFLVCTEQSYQEQSWLTDQVNIHEMAHSYFGDLVGCRDFSHVWLKESWATYMETCWLESRKGPDEMRYDLWRNAESYFDEADQKYKRPIVTRRYKSSWQMFDAHLYQGGACRLHTLRQELGDKDFWQGVKTYLVKFQNQVVETSDFRFVMETESGRSLQKFFDQWFIKSGYPDLKVTFSYDKDQKRGLFEISQKQATGEFVFDLRTDLGWTTLVDGKETHHVHPIVLSKERQSFSLPMDQEPLQVRFDPLGKVLHKLEFDPGEKYLEQQLTKAPDVVGRILAALVLGKSGKPKNIDLLFAAYQTEPFWGVRREIIRALGDSQQDRGIDRLVALLGVETDHLVLDRLMAVLGKFKDDRVKSALLDYLEEKQLPPKAWANGLLALGKQHDPDVIEPLRREFVKDKTPQKIAARASLQAMGASRVIDVIPELSRLTRPEHLGFRLRKAAVSGVAQLIPYVASHLARPIEERLIELLRDPDLWVREAAVQGIHQGRVVQGLTALKSYAHRLSPQERVSVDAIIAELSAEDPAGRQAALEKNLEDLKSIIRKLESRVQDLEDKKSGESKNGVV